MTSIALQAKVEKLEIEVSMLKKQLAEHQQVVDALTSIIEKRATEAEEDRTLVKQLVEMVGKMTMKGAGDGIRGGSVRKAEGKKPEASDRR